MVYIQPPMAHGLRWDNEHSTYVPWEYGNITLLTKTQLSLMQGWLFILSSPVSLYFGPRAQNCRDKRL